MTTSHNLLCIGLGYTAEALARRVGPLGWRITGTGRSPDALARIASLGHTAIPFDGTMPSPLHKRGYVLHGAAT